MKLCTFEVRTHLGRSRRLGAVIPQGIVDLNFAAAWHLSSQGETRPYEFAAVVLPDNMLEFLEGGATSVSFAARSEERRVGKECRL